MIAFFYHDFPEPVVQASVSFKIFVVQTNVLRLRQNFSNSLGLERIDI